MLPDQKSSRVRERVRKRGYPRKVSLVGEPNRQLKVPVPQHRVVNQKLDGSPVQDGGIVTGDYVAGGAASLLAGNVTKTKAALR